MGTFILICGLGVLPWKANIYAKFLAGFLAFFGHRIYTFQINGKNGAGFQAIKYVVALGINIPLTSLLLISLLNIIHYPSAAKLISDVIAVAVSFWIGKKIVFQAKN